MAKGIRLENILVLLLRILMLVLLVLLLSQLFFPEQSKVAEDRIIHLVQPNRQITEEFKFELQQALEKGEEVFWMDDNLSPIENVDNLESDSKVNFIQASLDNIPANSSVLNLYLGNSQNALKSEFYLSPIKPTLHVGSSNFTLSQNQLISIEGGKELFLNEKGLLDSLLDEVNGTKSVVLKKEDFAYFLGEISDAEQVFIKASLDAIRDIYGFNFLEIDQIRDANLVFDSQYPAENSSDKLYFISGTFSFSEASNVVLFSDQLDFEHAELVQTGKLPEVILEKFLAFSGVQKHDVQLSKFQLERRFLVKNQIDQDKKANINLLLFGLFILCFGAERYLANRQRI